MQLQNGTTLQGGKYQIIRFIGNGGFGCTYEAQHVMLDTRVAIKEFFVKDFCNRDETTCLVTVGTQSKKGLVDKLRRKFIDEAKSLWHLQHQGIVKVIDVFEENGTAYYVMDYIDGHSLSELVKDHPLPEKEAVDYICQICDALKYVHENNRLHLDIKPANIMITADGKAVLIDFGAAKQYDEENGENTSTLLGKTPGYAPPEQMGNDVVHFTPATDIYAIGATLYKALTGITPPTANMLTSGEALPPLPAEISRSTKDAILAAMQLNKKLRPQSVDEFIAILDGASTSETSEETEIVDIEDAKATKSEQDQTNSQAEPKHVPIQPATEQKTVQPKSDSKQTKSKLNDKRKVKRIIFSISGLTLVIAIILFIISIYPNIETNIISNKALDYSDGDINGYKYVDLGLPSGLLWATCNIDAESSRGHGNIYAWGNIDYGIEKTTAIIDNISGNPKYDVARSKWGGSWRIPTKEEFQELVSNCLWKYKCVEKDGYFLAGYLIIGPNKKSIFLPIGNDSDYWTSSSDGETNAHSFLIIASSNGSNAALGRLESKSHVKHIRAVSNPQINGHEYVDLGMPSGLKWATCNVGANSPEESGNYYAWGETATKTEYTEENSKTRGKEISFISEDYGYDVARANWGETWRIPTKDEYQELIDKCTWEWTTNENQKGYKVTGPNGHSIFIPAAGARRNASQYNANNIGYYWSSTPDNKTTHAFELHFNDSIYEVGPSYRGNGIAIRAVSK